MAKDLVVSTSGNPNSNSRRMGRLALASARRSANFGEEPALRARGTKFFEVLSQIMEQVPSALCAT
jgi:hypothetical protein